MKNKSAILILSGGLDSTVCLYHLIATGWSVRALSIDYGQRHRKELKCAAEICRELGVEHQIADLSGLRPLLKGSSQTDDAVAVPHGHYAAENMKVTIVPNRNALMLSAAVAWAISTKSRAVAYAAHAGDHAIYPDCRPEFASAFNTVALLADHHQVVLERPFIELTKADIVRRGHQLEVPFELTWTCYEGGDHHCGKCGTCVERLQAFDAVGISDPALYRDYNFYKTVKA